MESMTSWLGVRCSDHSANKKVDIDIYTYNTLKNLIAWFEDTAMFKQRNTEIEY